MPVPWTVHPPPTHTAPAPYKVKLSQPSAVDHRSRAKASEHTGLFFTLAMEKIV